MPVAHVFPPTIMLDRILTFWLPVLIAMEFGWILCVFYGGLDDFGGSRITFDTAFLDKCGRGGIETRVCRSGGANTMDFWWDTARDVNR